MAARRFSSESFPETARRAAWQELLGAVGLRSEAPRGGPEAHAAATLRGSPGGIVVARLAAGRQVVAPASASSGPPILLAPLEGGATLDSDAGRRRLAPGDLVLLPPRSDDARLAFGGDLRALVLSAGQDGFHGRRIGADLGVARVLRPEGLAGVLSASLAAVGEALDALSEPQWDAVEASLAELALALLRGVAPRGEAGGETAARGALLGRLIAYLERHLEELDLSPARAAASEGISERYLHRLFEATGESFASTLRERRLLRCRRDLTNPAEANNAVSEIAFRCGFADAAHFSRAFRDRFGVSPRAFRQDAERSRVEPAAAVAQRGWPERTPAPASARARPAERKGGARPAEAAAGRGPRRHHLPVAPEHVHWGYFSRSLKPVLEVGSGDTVTVETLSQHASDDPSLMIEGDPGAESVFRWTEGGKAVDRRGAGPLDASIYGRGAGEGFGVHICTGPIAVRGAEPGDVLEVRILDIAPRPSRAPGVAGRAFGSSVAAWWGYHYGEFLAEPKPREIVTIYEVEAGGEAPHARALYSYRWTPRADPSGVVHPTYDYPGVPVAPETVARRSGVLDGVRVPLRPHFGVVALAPREAGLVDSVPPSYFGGNLDNWRLGRGAAVYLPVSVPGALLSVGDPHAAQGDGELSGTAIECSMTGTLLVTLHKRADLGGRPFADLTYPLIETGEAWVLTGYSHPDHLAEFGVKARSAVYATSSLDLAMRDAFRKVRRFLMAAGGLDEDEAVALVSAAVDFGVTQVADGNWGVHAVIAKALLPGLARDPGKAEQDPCSST